MKNFRSKILLLAFTLISTTIFSQDITLEMFSSGNLSYPVELTKAGDNRYYVVEQAGTIKIMTNDGTVSSTPFMDISDRIPFNGSQHGLLGLAFHPEYITNGYFFVYYIGEGDSTVISRFSVTEGNADLGDKDSELRLITYPQPASDHKAGCMKFGPDGYLYIASGDGGKSTNGQYSQNLKSYLGKMLRIDVDTEPYTIPDDNPFIDDENAFPEIWSYGLRNPWKFSFDSETGDLWIGDVGGDVWDDVNYQKVNTPGGLNYGWPCYEGNDAHLTDGCDPMNTMEFPVFTFYQAEPAIKVSLHGGFVYRGENCLYNGHYIFAEAYSGEIIGVYDNNGSWDTTSFGIFDNFIVSFAEGYDKELYAISYNLPPYSNSETGIYKLTIAEPDSCNDTDPTGIISNTPGGKAAVNLYPNPATTSIHLENLTPEQEVYVLDATGRIIKTVYNVSGTKTIDISELKSGLYFVRSEDDLVKFIKEK